MSNLAKCMGEKIKSLREYNNLTQSNIAHYLKVDQSFVSKVEKGERSLTSDMLDSLATLFGVQLGAFMDEDVENWPPLSLALRANELSDEDLQAISDIKRIALNSSFMAQMLKGGQVDG